ncbi:MAG: hypothetical protein ACR2GW_02490 [Pyrinomonadaceae bacterium]
MGRLLRLTANLIAFVASRPIGIGFVSEAGAGQPFAFDIYDF